MDADEIVGRFYRRAEKLRNIASCTQDQDCREAMLRWAEDYERMAERAIEAASNLLKISN